VASSPAFEKRIDRAARRLEAANHDLLELLASLSDEQWRATRTVEGWPVIALAYHVADGYRIHLRWLDFLRARQPVPGTPADLDEENARTVADARGLSPGVVRSAAETAGRLLVAYVRDLDPDELHLSAPHGPLGGDEISVESMLDITAWHVLEHLASMRAAVAM
jgi:uncharacterized damage-inducible protein DinB